MNPWESGFNRCGILRNCNFNNRHESQNQLPHTSWNIREAFSPDKKSNENERDLTALPVLLLFFFPFSPEKGNKQTQEQPHG